MDPVAAAAADDEAAVLSKLLATRSNLVTILAASSELNKNLDDVDNRLSFGLETVTAVSDAVAPLQIQSIAAKALHSRINRAVSPALSVLHSFSLVESLQRRLVSLSDDKSTKNHLARLLKYVDCVDRLNAAIGAVTAGCEPAVLRLQEAVEFLSRTKATDQLRIHRLRETLGAIKALYESEVDAMRYEGLLDEALLRLQDEFEGILQQIKHKGIGQKDGQDGDEALEMDGLNQRQLGSDLEVEVLGRISETLASNDCMDICIDIYVKVRYRRAAKGLMRLNPRYLKTFAPEDLDKMEWEALESAITLWIEHFQLAVKVVFGAEKHLCNRVLSGVMDGAVWPECFAKIADKIMAVFFRFGEGVARSAKEPQKLFKLLDMYDAMDRIRTEFAQVFDGESGVDICARFRELQKLLVHSASQVFWEFGLQIEGLEDSVPPPADGSVPKIVRYAVNYLKCLAAGGYGAIMGQVLHTEQMWKAGFLSRPEPDESLLREAVLNTLDALQRNVESKRIRYKDRVVSHILAMNTYWYMYMRTRGSELAKLVGEETMKKKYKKAAEEAAYTYQAQAWGPLVKLLQREELTAGDWRDASGAVARGKMEAFMREFDENLRTHKSLYFIPDADFREQIKDAVAKAVVPAYATFLHSYSGPMQGRSFLPPGSIRELLGRLFDGGIEGGRKSVAETGRMKFSRRGIRNRAEEERDKGEEEKYGGGGNFEMREEGGRFRRREEEKEREGSVGMREERKEGQAIVRRREEREGGSFWKSELKNQEEERVEVEGSGRMTMAEGGRTNFRRREFRNREKAEKKNEVEEGERDGGGGGSGEGLRRGMVEGERPYIRRREFKSREAGGSGPLEFKNRVREGSGPFQSENRVKGGSGPLEVRRFL